MLPKISKNASTLLSLVCAAVGFGGLLYFAGCLLFYPRVLTMLYGETCNSSLWARVFAYALSFGSLLAVGIADGFLVKLLLLVRKHAVFSDKAVSCLRTISWLCFFEVVLLLCAMVFYRRPALLLAFVAAFIGLVLRVVKNVIEEAEALKKENDFTI